MLLGIEIRTVVVAGVGGGLTGKQDERIFYGDGNALYLN